MALTSYRLKEVKLLRDEFRTWNVETDRREFLRRLRPLIRNWHGRAPDILDIFDREEIECLLADSVKYLASDDGDGRDKSFIDFVVRCRYRDQPNVDNVHRRTPLHHLAISWPDETSSSFYRCTAGPFYSAKRLCLSLFKIYDTFRVNYIDDESGYTHFHVACRFGCEKIVKKFLELRQEYPNIVQQKTGDRPLHIAVNYCQRQVMELLLKAGADPNLLDRYESTALHALATPNDGDGGDNFYETVFELTRDEYRPLKINARNSLGDTPLHCALNLNRRRLFKLLLENGADPNLVDNYGATALHRISENFHGGHLGDILFPICDSKSHTVLIDVEDAWGNTPLMLALRHHNEKMVDLLIRRGADPDLNVRGSTALHVICRTDEHDESAKMLFKICDEINRTVQVEARDYAGRTPLQLAVTNILPNTVELLLRHGADVANCVFPSPINPEVLRYRDSLGFEMRVASGALAVAEHLQSNGYDFSRSDALAIMKFFHQYELFKKSSTEVEENWYDDDEAFAREAEKIMITSGTSLYHVLRMRPEEEDKLLTYTDYYEFAHLRRVGQLAGPHYRTTIRHLCEKMARGFFLRWTLDDFSELIHKRLPTECCEKILDNLTNEDLCHICLAAAGERSS